MPDQTQRIVFMLKKFQTGHKYTTAEVHEMICKEFGEHSLRTVQRDMLLIKKSEPAMSYSKTGKEYLWYIPREIRNTNALMRIDHNELLSFHILKAHLKTFTGTIIEEDVKKLAKKIEQFAPNDIYAIDSLFWDQNIGHYDYSQHDDIIRKVVDVISNKQWVNIDYNTSSKGVINQILVLLRCLFTYNGSVYAVAYVPKHDTHIALTLQNIKNIEVIKHKQKAPDFEFKEWTKNRFGVFYGNIRRVVLKVQPEFKHYFVNRKWHQSQILTEEEDGSLTIEFKVPIGADFVSWILSWGDAIKVEKPIELIEVIKDSLNDTLKQY